MIYEGTADAVVFGTTTDYGYKMRVMPFAFEKPGYFNLKVANTGVTRMLLNLNKLWDGSWEHPEIYDYLVREIKIESSEAAPLQLGGDPEGYKKIIKLKISKYTQDFLSFLDS